MKYDIFAEVGSALNPPEVAPAVRATNRQVMVTICGSFRRDPQGLRRAYDGLSKAGCQVLSPTTLDWAAEAEGFVYGAHELERDPADIEQLHLGAMRSSHFVWLHAPEGYVGRSAAMEIGYAHGLGIPVYSVERPVDVTMASLVTQAESPDEAIALIRDGDAPAPALGLGSLQLYYERASLARGWEDETAEDCMRLLAGGLFAYGLSGECDANANSSFCRQLAHLKRTAKAEGGESLACKLDALGGLLTDGALYYAEPEGLILKIFAGGSNTLLGVQLYRDC